MNRKHWAPFIWAALATLPGCALHLLGIPLTPPVSAFVSGAAILGASFLLLWACDAAQADISQALALAAVALIAVLPEYSVDMYFTWQAGRHPESDYAQYAIANMTGANRLLIGVAWSSIALLYWLRFRRNVRLEKDRFTELLFLALATAYAFVIPFKGSLTWFDAVVFIAIYAWYIRVAGRRPSAEVDAEGPAELLIRLPRTQRRLATMLLFLLAAGVIVTNAQPFCEGLVDTGKLLRINEFVLVQWLAPVASEAPEFVVALVFVWRGQASLGLGSLLSAMLNQWTLLVGMIPAVYALSSGTLAVPIPMTHYQMDEIFLTAAQSLLGIALLLSSRLTPGGALLLLGMFAGQLTLPELAARFPLAPFGLAIQELHGFFAALYIAAGLAIILQRPRRLARLAEGLNTCCAHDAPPAAQHPTIAALTDTSLRTPECAKCKWRIAALRAQTPAPAHCTLERK